MQDRCCFRTGVYILYIGLFIDMWQQLLLLGLVDHMHKDHADHQPWACTLCPVKTAFVKTLYRHLKQVQTNAYF
jgi:hypothetical protein